MPVELLLNAENVEQEKRNNMKTERPKCGCGNTQDPNGYCDGSHLK